MCNRQEDSAAAGAPEIEITPEMIEAGRGPLLQFHRERNTEEEAICRIYRAMASVDPNRGSPPTLSHNQKP